MINEMQVLSVGSYLSAPLASRILSDLGAQVIKVENIDGGDPYRYLNHPYDNGTPDDLTFRFLEYNRGKRSIGLDLDTAQGVAVFQHLAENTDIVIENLKPGKMDEFKVGYEDLKAVNESIIYCDISGYGNRGPYRNRPAMDGSIQAISGLIHQNAADAGRPAYSGLFLADIVTGMYTSMTALAAYISKIQNDQGAYFNIPLLDCLVSLFNHEVAEYSARGTAPPAIRSSFTPYGVYETDDGALFLNVSDEKWPILCEIMGFKDWLESEKYASAADRRADQARIDERLDQTFATESTDYWTTTLLSADILMAPVKTVDEILESEHVSDRDLLQWSQNDAIGEFAQLDFPVKLSDEESQRDVPRFGEHTEEILLESGISSSEIEDMYCDRVIADYNS